MNFWLKIVVALAAIWAVAGGAMYWARSRQPTAETVSTYIQKADVASRTGDERVEVIKRVQSMLNRLGYEDRQQLRREGVTKAFFEKLTPTEQTEFLDATLPAGFRQMMEAFNKMEPQRRRRIVERAINDLKKNEDAPLPQIDEALRQRFVEQGMRSFYNDASAETKLDLAPFIEQMQRNLQGR